MTRKQPPAPPAVVERKTDIITQVRRYKLITPLFGGGVETKVADPVTVVRATEVRGHLRFWWRATRGGRFEGNLQAFKLAEDGIWGTVGTKEKSGVSKVVVTIEIVKPGTVLRDVEISSRNGPRRVELGHPSSPYSYVAFPLRSEPGKAPGAVREGVEFTLTIRYPASLAEDVAAAVWAWETFGGVGARTRRGFGALQCVSIIENNKEIEIKLPPTSSVLDWVNKALAKHVVDGKWPDGVPHLGKAIQRYRVSPQNGSPNADEAWRHLFGRLKAFRQSRFDNDRQQPYGRSKWPEPDAIRDITRQSATKHSRRRLIFNKFPRAKFGLPIVFQFKDTDITPSDPSQTMLQGAEHDRLASPLILRPLACAGGKAVGIALLLIAPSLPPGGVVLKVGMSSVAVQADLDNKEANQIPPLNSNPNVLQAFLDYLK